MQTAHSLSDSYPMKTTWRGYVLYAVASVFAILLGVIPALWINRWRYEAPAVEDTVQPAASVGVTVEPITAPEPTQEPTTAAAAPPVEQDRPAPAAGESSPVTTKRRAKPERVKRPSAKQPKRPPPCDVYLHPHGCPR